MINLLPADLRIGKKLGKSAQTIGRFVIAASFVVVVLCALGVGVLVMLNGQKTTLLEKMANTRNTINQLEQREQRVVLIKDRIIKTQNILQSRDTYKVLGYYDEIGNQIASDSAVIKAMDVASDVSRLTITFKDSESLSNFLSSIVSRDKYSKVVIEELSFSSSIGYELVLNIY